MNPTAAETAIAKLNALTDDDPEQAHCEAENILVAFLKEIQCEAVANAFDAANSRVGFWYA